MNLRHPFITTPRLAIFYALFWFVAAAVNVLILTFANGIDFTIALVEVFSFILIYAVIGTAIWYVIKFSVIEDSSWYQLILAHAIAATIIVFIWIYSGMVVIKLLHPHPSVWLHRGW